MAESPLHGPLISWYRQNARTLPWRTNPHPYDVWVSEMMLQQTQVSTVLDYFRRWMQRFPTIESLAAAPEEEVMSMWQGLGYYQRARSLHAGAKLVASRGIPKSASEWRDLPGIGPYTAGAISSISQNHPEPVVDGNVERVYARITGDAAAGPQLNRNTWQWARTQIMTESPGDWNQALMELGATVCTPMRPRCHSCPISSTCFAFAQNAQSELPKKPVKKEPIALSHFMWIPHSDGKFAMEKIAAGRWWEGLWSFPHAEDESSLKARFPDASLGSSGQLRHAVTNHRITLQFRLIETAAKELTYFSETEMNDMAIPAPHRKAWETLYRQPAMSLS